MAIDAYKIGRKLGGRLQTQELALMGAVGALAAAAASVMLWYDATAGLAVPFGLLAIWLMVRYPYWAYVLTLAQLSVIPIEGHFFGFYVPNFNQLLMPGVFMAALAHQLVRRNWGVFRFHIADWVAVGFLVAGYAGIFLLPGERQWKYYTNQVVFPALLYFAARLIEMDRQRFQVLLATLLASMSLTSLFLTARHFVGWEPWGQGGRGPFGAFADAAAYVSVWPPLFLYAAVRAWAEGKKRMAYAWTAGLILTLLAATGTHERTGFGGALLGMFVAALGSKRMMRALLIGLFVASPVLVAWTTTTVWKSLHRRFKEPDPLFRRRLYRMKALNYIKSDEWNAWLGTGFARLSKLSQDTIPGTLYVFDPRWRTWRSARALARRPIHCAPLTLYGEYGVIGSAALIFFAALLLGRWIQLMGWCRNGKVGDRELLVAIMGSVAAVVLNGIYHNTDTVVQVVTLCWSCAGMFIYHPRAFLQQRKRRRAPVRVGSVGR